MNGRTGRSGARPAAVPGRRSRRAGFVLPFLVLASLLVACEGGDAAPRVGGPAPAYAASTLDGRELALADLRGEVVVLNIWATWCGPCVREMPGLEKLHRRYGERGLHVVGASIDRGSAEATVRRYLDEHGITFTILLDPDDAVSARFRAIGVPETFLIDREGTIRYHWIGEFDPGTDEVRERIEALLPEAAA